MCHLPPGTSKWNQIEHRLSSHIIMNWRGRPLTSHETIVNTIATTTTRTGLRVHAELDTRTGFDGETGLPPLRVGVRDPVGEVLVLGPGPDRVSVPDRDGGR